jgi:transcriptional regulator with XRE-family HTH domain
MVFAEVLADLRKKNRYSRKELAEKIGVSERIVTYYEKGEKNPTLDSLLKIADFFNVSMDYLVSGASESETDKFIIEDMNNYLNTLITYLMKRMVDSNRILYPVVERFFKDTLPEIIPGIELKIDHEYLLDLFTKSSNPVFKRKIVDDVLFAADKKLNRNINSIIENLVADGMSYELLEKYLKILFEVKAVGSPDTEVPHA